MSLVVLVWVCVQEKLNVTENIVVGSAIPSALCANAWLTIVETPVMVWSEFSIVTVCKVSLKYSKSMGKGG